MICRVKSIKLYLQQNEFMSIKCQKVVISTNLKMFNSRLCDKDKNLLTFEKLQNRECLEFLHKYYFF